MRKLTFLVLAVFIAFNIACTQGNEGDASITLPDYSDWDKVETTFLWHTKDGTKQGVVDVVLYSNISQDSKRHTIAAFKHPNEEIQFAWHEIIGHEDKKLRDYFFEKKETDENWLFVADVNEWSTKQLNVLFDKRYNFQF